MNQDIQNYKEGKAPCDRCGRITRIIDMYVDETFGESLCEKCFAEEEES